jgi:REP-associated tyrosine transposase
MARRSPKQLELPYKRRGGKRRGAGRKPKGERAGVSHKRRAKLSRHHPMLVTMRVRAGLPSLRCDAVHEIVRGAIAEASERPGFQVIVYSVQTNHIHMVIEAESQDVLARGMNSLGARIAKRLNKFWRRKGQVFPDRYHGRALTAPRACRYALIYVLQNARKHGSWRALAPDVYSSGPLFDGWSTPVAINPRAPRSYMGKARTWLLTHGWRRHGLIDPKEVPAKAA